MQYSKPLFFFALSLFVAYYYGWSNTDLIWSFWVTSLVVGYATILRSVFVPVMDVINRSENSSHSKSIRSIIEGLKKSDKIKKPVIVIIILIVIIGALFNLAFFSVHFLGFHFGHAVFMQSLFPHPEIAVLKKTVGLETYFDLLKYLQPLLLCYWPIIVQKLIYDFPNLGRFLNFKGLSSDSDESRQMGFFQAYINVVKIHILIFILVGLNAIHTDQYLTYVIIFSIFFFPFSSFKKKVVPVSVGSIK